MATTLVLNGGYSPQQVTSAEIGTPISLLCEEGAGLWTFVDKPAGSTAAMDTITSTDTNAFTPDKEGTYFIRCTRGGGGAGNVGDGLLVVASDGFTDVREIAWKETLEHAARGWAVSVNNAIRWLKRAFNRPKHVLVKVDASYVAYTSDQHVWRTVGSTTLPSGETVPLVLPAASETSGVADLTKSAGLVWKPSTVVDLVAGDVFHALVEGYVSEDFSAVASANSPVYLNGTEGQISTLAGLAPIVVGRTAYQSGGSYRFYFKPEPITLTGAFTGKGDLLIGTAFGAYKAKGIGSNGEVLKVDTTTDTNVKWDTLAQIIKDTLLTADGDILIRVGGTVQRLAVGAAHTGLHVNSGATAPEWASLAQKIKDTLLTADGDILVRVGGTVQRLAIGTAGQIMQVNGGATAPAWASLDDTAKIAKALLTTAGDLIYATAGSTPARLAIGTAGQVLRTNAGATAPEWWTLDDTAKIAKSLLTTAGDLIYATGAGTPARLPLGTAGQFLKVNAGATAPEWGTGVDPALYSAKGVVLGASAASTPAAVTDAVEGGVLTKTDESSSGARWDGGFGFPARLVSTTSGPYDLNDGDVLQITTSTGINGVYTESIYFYAGSVSNINAVTAAEVVSIVNALGSATLKARVRDDGKFEIYIYDTGMSPLLRENPAIYLRIASLSSSVATAFGMAQDQLGFGSGGTPPSALSNNGPFTFAGTETLTTTISGPTNIVSNTFSNTDTTAADVAARLNGTTDFANNGLLAVVEGSAVRVILLDATAGKSVQFSGTANTALGLPTSATFSSSRAFHQELGMMQGLSASFLQLLLTLAQLTSLGTSSGSISIDPTQGATQTLSINGTSSFTMTNIGGPLGMGFTTKVLITASGGTRTVSFDSNWRWIGTKPSSIASGVTGCLTLFNVGSSNADIVAEYSVLGTG